MTNAVAVIALTYRGTDIQEAFGASGAMFLEIVRGLNEPAAVRGSDIIVPGKTGRLQGSRQKDLRTVELEGILWGATGATERTTYRTKVATFQALFDPTIAGALVATLEDGTTTKTLANTRTLSVAWDHIAPGAARVNVLLESTAPDWT